MIAKNLPTQCCGRCALFEPSGSPAKVVKATGGSCRWTLKAELPISVTTSYRGAAFHHRYMSADEGADCPTWEAVW